MSDHSKQIELLEKLLNSEEGKASMKKFFNDLADKKKIAEGRYRKFEKWLETHDLDEIMQRLEKEHCVEWRNKCYNNGYEPYPNNKLAFLIDYVVHNYYSISVPQIESEHFANQSWFFKGYYINMTWGQGVFTQIFDSKFNQIIVL